VLKERERQIRESEALLAAGRKLSSVLEGLRVGVLIADTEGRVNPARTYRTFGVIYRRVPAPRESIGYFAN
jgi:hypothetical protein